MNHRLMDLVVADQYNIIWLQQVRFPFNDVADVSPKKDQQLVEIMIMKGKGFLRLVSDMEQAEGAVQISFFQIAFHEGILLSDARNELWAKVCL